MLGKLSLDAIPSDPIALSAALFILIGAIIVVSALTYLKRWRWLWSEWLTTVDHKKIGILYFMVALIMLLRGFADALMMRLQLAAAATGSGAGYLPPEHYDQIFTAHGVIMIFFVAMPMILGLMNVIVPLQIGARDVAFPFLNSFSFWLFMAGVILINLSLGIGEFAQTGWLAYPPLSSIAYSPGVGVDYWIWSLQISGLGTLLSGVNFITTIVKMRAPGMTLMKMPVFTWTALCTNALIVAAFPILTATLAMLTLERYLGFHFFTNDMGGNQMMYVNLIWAWGHPEVYILILPMFGVYSEVIATFSQKRLFGYASLVMATVAITVLSFMVWLHHFFTMGGSANVNAFFGIATMVIAIPTGIKIFNWLFTMYRGRIIFSVPVLWTLGFLFTFTLGGMTGVLLAVPGANYVLHNSMFLVAHFHNVIIGGVVFGAMAAFNYWFPKAFGFTLNERLGRWSFGFWMAGFFTAFMPLYVLGFMGMTRRISYGLNPEWFPMLAVASIGAVMILIGIVLQLVQIWVSFRDRHQHRDLSGDPWQGRTLEWATSSPPPFYNFAVIPKADERDAFHDLKARGEAPRLLAHYEPIHMPRNTGTGFIISMLSAVFGFAMIWAIWWLAVASLIAMVVYYIRHTFNDDLDYYVSSEEVAAIETAHYARQPSAGEPL
ncbi:MAG: cytochrome o ubiquinol oxidase subunit I [Neisseriaceae bacterium]|nr:cytochrome o ubiquinol oxidase subunit I [Neisseriaceae bacterium]MBP6861835.1 cytochrome o ubiquinol oxidase subunit I [Neisseriaceae bacterium]